VQESPVVFFFLKSHGAHRGFLIFGEGSMKRALKS
jgi:hypothetical protein